MHCAEKEAACQTYRLWQSNDLSLHQNPKTHGSRDVHPLPIFHPEFGRFMLEATPGKPWGIGFKDLLDVESNMKWRLVSSDLLADAC